MKQEPRIIFSLSAYPLINNRWHMGNRLKEAIYMTALSVLYCHLWYRDIELYVDETAYKYLYMLPCRVTKIKMVYNKELWMKAKIFSIEKQTTPFVHLDTDVFIKKKIDFNFKDVMLERKEGGYRIHYKRQVDFFNNYTQNIDHWRHDLGRTYNCGVLGFNNLDLRNKFVRAYYDLEEIYLEYRDEYQPLKKQGFEPCILIEQYNLSALLDYYNITPTLLLKGRSIKEQGEVAKQLGYSHLFGIKKYQKGIVQEIEHRLYKIFPYWYAQVKMVLEKHKLIDNNNKRDLKK